MIGSFVVGTASSPLRLAGGLHALRKDSAKAHIDDQCMTTTTPTTTNAVDRLLAVVVGGEPGRDIFSPTAELDATVPGWRFSVTGDAIRDQLAKWFADSGELEELERHDTPTGAILTYTVTWTEGGVPAAARQVHVLTIDDDRITRDQFWCGGRWPAPLLAEMEAARR